MKTTFAVLFAFMSFMVFGQKASLCKKHSSDNVYEIDIYSAYKEKKSYPLSTISESIEYIPLEKTKDCIIGTDIGNIFISSTDIFVFDFKMGSVAPDQK